MMHRVMWILMALVMTTGMTAAEDAERRQLYDLLYLDGLCERLAGHADAAYDLFSRCIETDSTRPEAYFYLAQYLTVMHDKGKALAYFQKAADLAPTNAIYLETVAQAYVSQQRYAEAIAALERLYDKNHDREDVLTMLVQLYEQENDHTNAIRTLERLELIEGKSERLSLAKVGIYQEQGNKRAAIAEMKRLAEQYPNDLNYSGMYADILLANDQEKKALDIYKRILREEPLNSRAQIAMRAYYRQKGDSAMADTMTMRLLTNRSASTNDKVYVLRDEINENESHGGDSTKVLGIFRRALAQPQGDADMTILMATYMELKKMPRDSIAPVLEQVLQIAPDNAAARLQLVGYAWEKQDMDRVIDLCQSARQYTPDEMAFYYYQGMAYLRKDDTDHALGAFQNGIGVINDQSNPDIVSDFYAAMGDLLHQKGRQQEAFAAYDSCLQWKDDNIGCLNNYAYYLSEVDQQLDRAEQMSYKTIKAEPKNPTYLDTYAWILFKQKRYAEAKIYIDQTLLCDSDSSAVMVEHAGDIYAMNGDIDKAVELWQQALKEEPEKQVLIRKIKLKKYIKE